MTIRFGADDEDYEMAIEDTAYESYYKAYAKDKAKAAKAAKATAYTIDPRNAETVLAYADNLVETKAAIAESYANAYVKLLESGADDKVVAEACDKAKAAIESYNKIKAYAEEALTKLKVKDAAKAYAKTRAAKAAKAYAKTRAAKAAKAAKAKVGNNQGE